MFLQLPFDQSPALQHAALVVNTVLLISALIAVELLYAESAPGSRKQLRFFLPLFLVLAGLLLYAVYKQVSKS